MVSSPSAHVNYNFVSSDIRKNQRVGAHWASSVVLDAVNNERTPYRIIRQRKVNQLTLSLIGSDLR